MCAACAPPTRATAAAKLIEVWPTSARYWSFPAIAPLSSRLFRDKIPPGYGSHRADAGGRIRQHSLPAGPVTLVVEASGFKTATKQVRLVAGETTRLEMQLTQK